MYTILQYSILNTFEFCGNMLSHKEKGEKLKQLRATAIKRHSHSHIILQHSENDHFLVVCCGAASAELANEKNNKKNFARKMRTGPDR